MLTKISMSLVLCACLSLISQEALSASLTEQAKDIGKTVVEKAADAADKTEPVEQTGGVRATILHSGMDLIADKGVAMLAAKYPAAALALPVVKKLAKPLANKAHEGINKLFNRNKDNGEQEQAGEEQKEVEVKVENPKEGKPEEPENQEEKKDQKPSEQAKAAKPEVETPKDEQKVEDTKEKEQVEKDKDKKDKSSQDESKQGEKKDQKKADEK